MMPVDNHHQFPPDEVKNREDLAEFTFRRITNRYIALIGAAGFLVFALFFYVRLNYLQAAIFTILFLSTSILQAISPRIQRVDTLLRMKWFGGGMVFLLIIVSNCLGILSEDFYISFPWMFIIPVSVTFFFGKKIGILSAAGFAVVVAILIQMAQPPSLTPLRIIFLKANSIGAIITILAISLIIEKYRIRIQNGLVASQNQYIHAEKRQLKANRELQREVERRKASQTLLAESEDRFRSMFEESAVPLWEENWSELKNHLQKQPATVAEDLGTYFDKDPGQLAPCLEKMRLTAINQAALSLCGAESLRTLVHNIDGILPPPSGTSYLKDRLIALHRDGKYKAEITVYRLDGKPLNLLISSTIPEGFRQSWERVFNSVYDVTERVAMEQERKRFERQVQQTRHMQALSTLAGGIAHQFNNALCSIIGSLDLMEMENDHSPKANQPVYPLRESADRMILLTAQLLAYARGGKYRQKLFSMNDLIQKLLASERLDIPRTVKIALSLSTEIPMSHGDTTQIRMVMEAIVFNALEAMEKGGVITISTCRKTIADGPESEAFHLRPGDYTVLTVRDNGQGMDEETRKRIFEPFFTTKFTGRGLGMAAAYGIIHNHAGMIHVDSTPGRGTSVAVALPVAQCTHLDLDAPKKILTSPPCSKSI